LKYKKREYALAQFHFHSHSEQTIYGKTIPMEIHFVHKSSTDISLKVLLELWSKMVGLQFLYGKPNIKFSDCERKKIKFDKNNKSFDLITST
jgi:carbonic anhydrase